MHEFKNIFAWSYHDLRGVPAEVCQHRIELKLDATPSHQHRYRMNPNYVEAVKKDLDKLLAARFIYPTEAASWLLPIVVVPKKNGQLRICIDYRKLNAQTVKDPYPLPYMDTILDEVAGHDMYSFMDGFSGYNQIKLAPEDKQKTAFITEWEAFAYNVMPFGLCNAPSTFQCLINTIFQDFLLEFMKCFLDNFNVYNNILHTSQSYVVLKNAGSTTSALIRKSPCF